jgi:hypothetical protein
MEPCEPANLGGSGDRSLSFHLVSGL